jgi:hypothetical protein
VQSDLILPPRRLEPAAALRGENNMAKQGNVLYYSNHEGDLVHHNNAQCPIGNKIPISLVLLGDGGHPLCERCAALG